MNIGNYLKQIRIEKKYTLKRLANQLNITESMLSQIENNKVSPSLHSLESILRFYAINFSDFFKQVEQKRVIMVRREEQKNFEDRKHGSTLTLLASKLENNALESYIVELTPEGSIETAILPRERNGERFFYVLKGTLTVSTDGETPMEMQEGDSINYKSHVPCCIYNRSEFTARFLISGEPSLFIV
jgi:transcriptional regulator with XRE-family HTH domain